MSLRKSAQLSAVLRDISFADLQRAARLNERGGNSRDYPTVVDIALATRFCASAQVGMLQALDR